MTVAFSANWIGTLPGAVQAAIRARMVRRRYEDGQYIYRDGEKSTTQYQIVEGGIRLRSLMASGKEFMWVVYGPGDCIGYMSAIDGEPRPQDAIAVGQVAIDCLQIADFDALRTSHPEIDRAITVHLCHRLRELYRMYLAGNFLSLRQRLASQIEFLLEFSGTLPDGRPRDELNLTQEMLACSVCATRQAISKLLREWVDDGIIQYRYGAIRVIDHKRLHRIALEVDA